MTLMMMLLRCKRPNGGGANHLRLIVLSVYRYCSRIIRISPSAVRVYATFELPIQFPDFPTPLVSSFQSNHRRNPSLRVDQPITRPSLRRRRRDNGPKAYHDGNAVRRSWWCHFAVQHQRQKTIERNRWRKWECKRLKVKCGRCNEGLPSLFALQKSKNEM